MAWSNPFTAVAGDVYTAAEWNQYGRDNLNYLKGITDGVTGSGTQVNRGAAQSIPNATNTPITWTSELFDFGGWWTSGTNIVVPAGAIPAGYSTILVLATARIQFASNATGFRRLMILNNGAEFSRQTQGAISGDATDFVVVDFSAVAAGDIITAEVHQTSGGALDITAHMAIMRYAPAS